jgi:CubicO group peptidase (beta-lactamase class C family)
MIDKLLDYLQEEIKAEHIPGAVIHVSYKNEVVCQEAVGNRVVNPEKAPMTVDTIFDLASLTKVVATLPAILKLLETGKLSLHDRVVDFLPDFGQNGKENIGIFHLLTHTSGLPAHKPFYLQSLNSDEIIEDICTETLIGPIGKKVVYSDLGFILLYKIIEIITDEPFSEYVKREIFEPLEMHETSFNPSFHSERYAATEFDSKRNCYKVGIVHDDNAESMGGISGHAGLFSTVKDLANFAAMIQNDGTFKGKKILSKKAIDISRRNYTAFDKEYRGLGWIMQSPAYSSCGDFFSHQSYGHTGFTGTSIWFDPSIELYVILLTNRVHFGRKEDILRIRPRIHNIIRSHFD